jgi:hypothetical protein
MALLLFQEENVTAGDNDRTTRTTDVIPVAPREPAADTAAGGDHEGRQAAPRVVESDDHEEPGYGYGV